MRAIAAESSASSVGTSASVNVVETTSFGCSRNWYATSTSLAPARRHTSAYTSRCSVYSDSMISRRRSALERVRLVVDDERVLAFAPEDVEAAANDDAVVLECERPLAAERREPRHPSARGRTRSTRRQGSRPDRAPRTTPPRTTREPFRRARLAPEPPDRRERHARGADGPHRRSRVAASLPSRSRQTRLARAAGARGRARRSSDRSSARRARERCTTAAERRAPPAPGSPRAAEARCRAAGGPAEARRRARAAARRRRLRPRARAALSSARSARTD